MSLNLKLFTLAIIFLSVSCSKFLKEKNESREFFESLMNTVIGTDTILNEDCLGGEYNGFYEKLNIAILTKDLVGISFYINRIFYLEIEKCPIQDLKMIFNDFQTSWKNGNTWINIMKHSEFMKEKIHDFVLKSQKTPTDVGLFVGVLFKALVYGFTQL